MLKVMTQFSFYLPNKPGELKKLLMKVNKLNLFAAATFATKDGAIMRLVPQDQGSFHRVVKQHHLTFNKDKVLAVAVDDRPGGLLKLLSKLQQAHVNIEGMYIAGGVNDNHASCIMQVSDVDAARNALDPEAKGGKSKGKIKPKAKGKTKGKSKGKGNR